MSNRALRRSLLVGAWAFLFLVPASSWAIGGEGSSPRRYLTNPGTPRHRVLFLHGLGGSPQSVTAAELARAFERRGDRLEIVVPWLRPEDGPHTMTDQLHRIRRLLDAAPGKTILLGHSFGAKAALKLAKECPDKVSCVVGIAPSVSMLYSHWKRVTGQRGLPNDISTVIQGLERHAQGLQERRRRARQDGRHGLVMDIEDALGYNAVMKDLAAHDELSMERGVRSPTLIIHGGQDQAVSIHYVRRFAQHQENPGVQLLELPTADHHFEVLRGDRVDRRASRQVKDRMAEEISHFLDANGNN